MLRRGLGWVKGFITRWTQARTRQNYGYRVLIERTGATLSMKLPLGKYTAVDEAAAERAWVLLEKSNALSRMLQRELLAERAGGASTATAALIVARKTTRRGRMATRRPERRAGGKERMVTSKDAVWKRTAAVVSDSGDGEGTDIESDRNDDEEGRKDV